MRARLLLGRLLLAVTSSVLTLAVADLWLRTKVGACGRTPFRTSTIKGLPHELCPGRTTTYKGVPVRINRSGLRGAEIPPPIAGVERIALIGDSVTFGNGCPEEETIAAELERELTRLGRPTQVLNCGVPAYNADNVAVLLREVALELEPTRVIWIMVANDVTSSLRPSVIPADAMVDACADYRFGSPLLQMVNNCGSGLLRGMGFKLGGYVESILGQHARAGSERLRRALTEMQQLCRDRSLDFRVAIYPYMVRIDQNPFRPIEDECVQLCETLVIPCVRLSDAFKPDEDLKRFWVGILDAHPNGESNRAAVHLLAERLLTP